ncbi:glucokinase [Hydrogenophaga crassostreae]|uniref:Glucokinase n=1 Tax=Hydrogenophaga crassostreae TaxID=1763535 RepID=A0A170AJH6_9BURK|nr:glucokinase [Hydrogenophaga crassostreae]AOW13926.1 glucokinase [Hydrogenophaga crassostreae]OAD44109.1 glucokinase [Hydrogenophaga crassostreae]
MSHQPDFSSALRLLADVGGTNARFALQAGSHGEIAHIQTLPCADHATLGDAIHHYLSLQTRDQRPVLGSIAIANPIQGDRVQMTNHHWSFSISELRESLGLQRLELLNDFTALALALPHLPAADLRQIGGRPGVSAQASKTALGLIGPGTGLGVSGLVPDGRGGWYPLQGEGGHVTLAATNAAEHAVLALLQARYGHVSAERAVSGQGLGNLYGALIQRDTGLWPVQLPTAAEISLGAINGGDPRAHEALDLFFAFLGNVAGNLALTLGAWGGIFLGGGILPRLGSRLEQSQFRERFEAKGRFENHLKQVPVWVIEARQSPALLGAARKLDMATEG